MVDFHDYELTYKRSGLVNKEGKNKGREFFILQFRCDESEENAEGYLVSTVFVWADEVKDILLEVGAPYKAIISSEQGRYRLIALTYPD